MNATANSAPGDDSATEQTAEEYAEETARMRRSLVRDEEFANGAAALAFALFMLGFVFFGCALWAYTATMGREPHWWEHLMGLGLYLGPLSGLASFFTMIVAILGRSGLRKRRQMVRDRES